MTLLLALIKVVGLFGLFLAVMGALFGLDEAVQHRMRRKQEEADRRELEHWKSFLPASDPRLRRKHGEDRTVNRRIIN
jgi:hypothetical protein